MTAVAATARKRVLPAGGPDIRTYETKGIRMSRILRGALVAALSLLAFSVAASSAQALTVSPTGNYTFESTNPQLSLSSNGQQLTCSLESFVANMAADGTGTVPVNSASFSGCWNRLLGTFTVRQPANWSITTTLSAGYVRLTMTIPASWPDGLNVQGSGCTFMVAGTLTLSARPFMNLPTFINDYAISGSSLRITANNGGFTCFVFPTGLTVVSSGDFDLDRSMGISG